MSMFDVCAVRLVRCADILSWKSFIDAIELACRENRSITAPIITTKTTVERLVETPFVCRSLGWLLSPEFMDNDFGIPFDRTGNHARAAARPPSADR